MTKKLLPGKKNVFFINATTECPMAFKELLVYSYLVYRAGQHNASISARRLSTILHIDRRTMRTTLNLLRTWELARQDQGGRWLGLEPTVEQWGWFSQVQSSNTSAWPWWRKFGYFPCYLPERDLTALEAAVFWKVRNVAGTYYRIRATGLATQLASAPRSVFAAIEKLKAKALLSEDLKPDLKASVDYWQDTQLNVQPVREEEYKSLWDLISGWYGDTEYYLYDSTDNFRRHVDQAESLMLETGYTKPQIGDYWEAVADASGRKPSVFECFLASGFALLFKAVKNQHIENGYAGVPSLGYLLPVSKNAIADLLRNKPDDRLAWCPDIPHCLFSAKSPV